MTRLAYRKGPLGLAVLLDGKPWGSIKDRRNHGMWQVDVPDFNSATATAGNKPFQGKTTFPKLTDAKAAIEAHLRAST
jgi:hypothetical protein